MHQRVAPEWDSRWWQKLLLEVANRLELERASLSPVGKTLLVIKGGTRDKKWD